MARSLIVLEFNELVPELLHRFMAAGKLPNFKRLHDESVVAVTDAEEAPPLLEPWIQWVTVHAGVPYSAHRCFNLNDGPKYDGPRIWDLASRAGKKSLICGSMNAGTHGGPFDGYLLPDPWASDVKALPEGYFADYLALVRGYVHEHSAEKPNVSRQTIVRFARFMLAHGLSAATIWRAVRQLAGEVRAKSKWRRATILDRIQWDLFKALYRRERPTLATFFINSTAHFQHFHWREMEPGLFTAKPSADDLATYGEAIAYGYAQMDELVGEALKLAGPQTSVVLCTALSQQPMLHFEDAGGRQIFRHKDQASLLAWAGVEGRYDYAPIMSQQFVLTFADAPAAARAADQLAKVTLDGQQVMLTRLDGNKLLTGCMIDSPPPFDAQVTSGASNEPRPFWDLFYPLEGLRSGMHHPDGVLWVRTPTRAHETVERKVSLLELAPTFLALAGIATDHAFARAPMAEVDRALTPTMARAAA